MDRVLEPDELMAGEAEAAAYARADFSESNRAYVGRFLRSMAAPPARIVDLGCGPADIALRLVRALAHTHVTAVDGSAAMLEHARAALHKSGLARRITLHLGRLPDASLPEHHFDAVLSKDMLHHLPDPQVLWREARRLARPAASIFVMDLVRPTSMLEAREIVERVSGREDAQLKEDFFNSLCAAFTVPEVRAQLDVAGLPLTVERVSDRHMVAFGRIA
jgi:ubiquinone/menaquinone biosynthesis C-methylase UbiE